MVCGWDVWHWLVGFGRWWCEEGVLERIRRDGGRKKKCWHLGALYIRAVHTATSFGSSLNWQDPKSWEFEIGRGKNYRM